jgi:thiamine transport system permease protein
VKSDRFWNRASRIIRLLPLLFLGIFFFYPLLSILGISLTGSTSVLLSSATWTLIGKRLFFTCWQAALSTLLTFLVGLPGAYLFSHYLFKGKAILQSSTMLPFVLPTVVVAAAFNALLGPHGWVNAGLMALFDLPTPPVHLMNTVSAILIAHVFYNSGIIIRLVGGEWSRLDPRLGQAARTLGANPFETLRRVTLPLLKPILLTAGLLVFLFDFTSFGVILILGGFGFATLEVEIYTQAMQMLNLPLAGLISIVQLASTLVITSIYTHFAGKTGTSLHPVSESSNLRAPTGWQNNVFVYGTSALLFLILVLPILGLVIRSFTLPGSGGSGLRLTLTNYLTLFQNPRSSYFYVPPILAIRNSLVYALATALISLCLGLPAAYGLRKTNRWNRLGEALLMLPLGASAVTLGLGFIVAFFQPPFNWQAAPWLIPIAHSLVAMPFVVRSILPAIRSLPDELRKSAAMLGASPLQTWLRVDMPILSRAVLTGGIYAFTISIGEFGATTFLARPEVPTIPIAIYRYLAQPGELNYGQALAMSTILLVVCAVGVRVMEKVRVTFE